MDPAARTAFGQIRRWLANAPHEPPSEGLVILRDYLDAGLRRTLATFSVALGDRIEDKLPELTMPVLVVRGSRDPIVPQQWAQRVAALAPSGSLRLVRGAAHTVNYAAPTDFARLIESFLLSQQSPAEVTR